EAIQKLTAKSIREVRRGKGTYVIDDSQSFSSNIFANLSYTGIRLKDLYEIRLIFEPQAAYYAAQRATDEELKQILEYGKILEEKLLKGEDCVEINRLFHNSIAFSTHNEFMVRLVPIINSEIVRIFSETNIKQVSHKYTFSDHQMILNYMESREAQGARVAMELHILHSMKDYDF
ncbi:MAG: FCD domain-containing protein, partial [Angelakisella sp.]